MIVDRGRSSSESGSRKVSRKVSYLAAEVGNRCSPRSFLSMWKGFHPLLKDGKRK
jgi:hypothetical protein